MPGSFIDYEYEMLEEGERQYDDSDYLNRIGVDAKYVKRDTDKGNPFIEALPQPRTQAELQVSGQRGINGYSRETDKKKSVYEQILSILRLRGVRFPLPVNYELEEECFSALVLSYRARKMFRDSRGDIRLEYETKNRTEVSDGVLIGKDAAAANAGFTMIGYSGCGKSSSLETLFSNYPQLIIHHGEGLTTYPQIVHLVVQCPPHSNFRGLYKNIGIAIDRALGNVKPIYAKELDAGERGNLAVYNDRVRQCIERFSIGIIIFDEIQHLNFDTSFENSFESILELTNQTKVAFGVVGTEDAYGKIFSGNLRQSRRLGTEIHADKYCQNKILFRHMVKKLFNYQWFDEIIEPTDEMIDALYDCTKGIVDQLIGIYMYMNIDYVRSRMKKPVVDVDYIYRTANKHYPGIMEILNDINDSKAEKERTRLAEEANKEFLKIADDEKAKAAEEAAMKSFEDPDSEKIVKLKQVVVSRIMSVSSDYNALTIESAFDKVMRTTAAKDNLDDDTKVTQIVFKKLQKLGKTDKRKSTNKGKLAPATIRSYLLDENKTLPSVATGVKLPQNADENWPTKDKRIP